MTDRIDVRPLAQSDIAATAHLRHATFFKGTARLVEEDAAGLGQLVGDSSHEAALVAVANGQVIGTCLLVSNEIGQRHDVSPWLAGLVISPDQRGRGVGERLVRAIERTAADLGFRDIYLYTLEAEGFYARLGWTTVEHFEDDEGPAVLMRQSLHQQHFKVPDQS